MKLNYTTILAAAVTLAAGVSAAQAVEVVDLNTSSSTGWFVQRYEADPVEKASVNPVYSVLDAINSTLIINSVMVPFDNVTAVTIVSADTAYPGAWIEPTDAKWTAPLGSSTLSWVTIPNHDSYYTNPVEINGTSYIYMKTFTLGSGSYTLEGQFASDDWLASMTLVKLVNGTWEEVSNFGGLDTYNTDGETYYTELTPLSYTFNDEAGTYALVANVINSFIINGLDRAYDDEQPPMPTGFIFGGSIFQNAGSTIPEPASLSVLGMGAAALLARRRK